MPKPGQAQRREYVLYIDPRGQQHVAIVTDSFGDPKRPEVPMSVNLVYCDPRDDATDQYGCQVARGVSVPHQTLQMAPGNYWKWPDE